MGSTYCLPVRESLVEKGFEMVVIDESIEEILWVELKNKDDQLIGEGVFHVSATYLQNYLVGMLM